MRYSALALKLQGGSVLETCLTAAKFTVPEKQVCLCSHRIFFFIFIKYPAGPTLSISVYINQ